MTSIPYRSGGPLCRVLIAGHEAVCRALKASLDPLPGLEVTDCCHSAPEALARTRSLRPDAVLIDAAYFDGGAERLLWQLVQSGTDARIVAMADDLTPLPEGVIKVDREGPITRIVKAVRDEACDPAKQN